MRGVLVIVLTLMLFTSYVLADTDITYFFDLPKYEDFSYVVVALKGEELHLVIDDESLANALVSGQVECRIVHAVLLERISAGDKPGEGLEPKGCYYLGNGTVDIVFKITNVRAEGNFIVTPMITLSSHVPVMIMEEGKVGNYYYILYDNITTKYMLDWIPPVSFIRIPANEVEKLTLAIITNAGNAYVASTSEIEVKGTFEKTVTENGTVYAGKITEFKPLKYLFLKYDRECYSAEEYKPILPLFKDKYLIIKRIRNDCPLNPEPRFIDIEEKQFTDISKAIITYDAGILTKLKVFVTVKYDLVIIVGAILLIMVAILRRRD